MFKTFILISILFIQMNRASSECSSNIKCMHYGILNTASCVCDCFPGYSGTYCETAQCSLQSPACSVQFTKDMCNIDLIRTYCPQMCNSQICRCGIDSCLNGGTFDSNTCKCNCPANFFGKVCESSTKCSGFLTCLNNGIFNNNTCKCDCFQNYNGSRCENLLCSVSEPSDCTSFDKSYCTMPLIASYCPYLCGSCKSATLSTTTSTKAATSTATTTTTTSTSTATTSTTTTACPVARDADGCSLLTSSQCTSKAVLDYCPYLCGICKTGLTTTVTSTTTCTTINCENAGIFDSATCQCYCPLGFMGSACEKFNCTSSLGDPVECSQVECSYPGAKSVCPKKCYCSSLTTTTTDCTELTCQNMGVFDQTTCQCSCSSGFVGILCDKFDCTSFINDPDECSGLDCSNSLAAAFCPKKCYCSTCIPSTCNNNGVFDPSTCSCSCFAGFTGSDCDNFDCTSNIKDPNECTGIDCSIPGVSSFCPQNCFCQ